MILFHGESLTPVPAPKELRDRHLRTGIQLGQMTAKQYFRPGPGTGSEVEVVKGHERWSSLLEKTEGARHEREEEEGGVKVEDGDGKICLG